MLRIKEIIKSKGLEVQGVAKMLGVSNNTMSTFINGSPTVATLQKIADALNVHITELFEQPADTGNADLVAFIEFKREIYKAETLDQLKKIVSQIENSVLSEDPLLQ